ncbi:MAG: hypothetical protein CSA74_01175 [Rhodobacterales bacterium]|nr:MAG: hypothetical protein CSA74_01175 [Rhodobacterales bacterium]
MATIADAGECFSCASKLCRYAEQAGRQATRRIALVRGERIETRPAACMKLWTVLSGTAAICISLRDGRRQISGIERPGATVCGPMAHEDSPAWLEALEPVEICEIDLSHDIEALQQDAGFMYTMFEVVHTRLEIATRHLTTLGRLDSTERVTLFLAELAELTPGHAPVHLPLSREDIADYLGLNAETVSRIFSRLKKSGLFKFLSPTEYVVPDPAAVARRLPVPVARKPHNPMAALHGGEAGTPGGGPGLCPVIHDGLNDKLKDKGGTA